jgi:hypothetical protein
LLPEVKMLQFFDELPADPFEAFVYVENVFRKVLVNSSFLPKDMHDYMAKLLVAKRELDLTILPNWRLPEGQYELARFDVD